MKYVLTLVLLLVPASLYAQDDASKFETLLKGLLADQAVGQHVDHPEPIHPYFAEKYLRGDAWAAWAVEHNRAERKRSRENTDRGREVRVNIGSPFYPPRLGQRGVQTYKSYSHYIGGSSSPVMLYNPYASPE